MSENSIWKSVIQRLLRMKNILYSSAYWAILLEGYNTGKLLINMKTKISLQCPSLLVFCYFLYREGSEMGGPDGDGMFACGYNNIEHT